MPLWDAPPVAAPHARISRQTVPLTSHARTQPLERIVDRLSRAWGTVSHLKAVRDTEELRKAVEEVQPERVKLSLRLSQVRAGGGWPNRGGGGALRRSPLPPPWLLAARPCLLTAACRPRPPPPPSPAPPALQSKPLYDAFKAIRDGPRLVRPDRGAAAHCGGRAPQLCAGRRGARGGWVDGWVGVCSGCLRVLWGRVAAAGRAGCVALLPRRLAHAAGAPLSPS